MRSSFRNKLLKFVIRARFWQARRKQAKTGLELFEAMRRMMQDASKRMSFPKDCSELPGSLDGVPVLWVQGQDLEDDGKVLLYIHGGAFIAGSPDSHKGMVSRLSRDAGVRGCLVDYRLAPEHPFPAGLDDCVRAYKALLHAGHKAQDIVIGGDSAGGNLSMATLLRIKDEGLPLPAGALNLSGCSDLSFSGASITERQSRDPIVDASLIGAMLDYYAPGQDSSHPYLSPVKGDLSGLPPIYCAIGSEEVLYDDVLSFAQAAKDAGVAVTLENADDMLHVWQIFVDVIPEAKASLKPLAAFIRDCLTKQALPPA